MIPSRVAHRSELAAETAAAATRWSEPAGERLEALLQPYLRPDEAMPDMALVQELLGRLLEDRGQRLQATDAHLQESKREARQLRWQRNDEAEKLRELLRSARFYFDQLGGRGAGAKLGIGHGLSRMPPIFLVRIGREIAETLAEAAPPEAAKALALPDPKVLSRTIAEQAERLDALVCELRPQNAGSTHALGNKERSLEEVEKIVRRSAGFLAGLYKLCELPYLAKKVRPAFRRRARSAEAKEATQPAAEVVYLAEAKVPPAAQVADFRPAVVEGAEVSREFEARPAVGATGRRDHGLAEEKRARGPWGLRRAARRSKRQMNGAAWATGAPGATARAGTG